MANILKVGSKAICFVFLMGLFGHWFGGRQGALFMIILAFSLIYIIYVVGNQLAFSFFTCRKIEGQDPWNLGATVKKIASIAKIRIPEIYLIETSFPTAFSSGMTTNNSSIFLTLGLVQLLPKEELEAVIAQQIAFLKERSIIPALVGAVLATACLSLTENKSLPGKQPLIQKLVFLVFAPIAVLAIYLNFSGRAFLQADRLSTQWTGNPFNLAQALIKLDSYAKTQPPLIPMSLGHLFIVNPLTLGVWGRYFSLQPPIQKRITNLVGYYPI